MGGFGSGNFGRRSGRRTTRDVPRLSIAQLLASPDGTPAELPPCVTISDGIAPATTLWISTTAQPTGGVRHWLHCPRCRRRCAALYRVHHALACRTCHQLNYHSQRLTRGDRWQWRAQKLYARAGCTPHDEYHYRPKGMHQRTFGRLLDAADEWENAAFGLGLLRAFPQLAPAGFRG